MEVGWSRVWPLWFLSNLARHHGDVDIDQCSQEKFPGAASIVEEKNKALSPWTLAFSPEPPSSWCFRSFLVIENSSEVCPSAEHKGCVLAKSLQSCLILCRPHGLQSTSFLCPWGSPGKNPGVAMPSSRGSPQPMDQTFVSCIAGRFFSPLSHWESPNTRELATKILSAGQRCFSKAHNGANSFSLFIMM